MKGRTLTRAHLAEAVYQEVGLSRSESAELVDSILSEIGESLVSDGVPIMPRKVLVFRPSQVLKDRINGDETDEQENG